MTDFNLNEAQIYTQETKKKGLNIKFDSVFFLKLTVFIILLLSVVFVGLVVYFQRYYNDPSMFDIGLVQEEDYALHTLAKDLGYLEDEYLEVNSEKFKTDALALEELKRGRLDAVIVEDISLVSTTPEDGFKIIASVAKADSYKFVIDLKKSIYSKADLSDKAVGIAEEDSSKYWLSKNFRAGDIRIVYFNKKDLPAKLAKAEVDAILTDNPTLYEAMNYEGNVKDAQLVPQGNNTFSFAYIVSNEKNLKKYEEKFKLYLRSLKQAEDYYSENQVISADRLATLWRRELGYAKYIVQDYEYVVNLNAEHRAQVTDQARWKKASVYDEEAINKLFFTSTLRSISPESVSL